MSVEEIAEIIIDSLYDPLVADVPIEEMAEWYNNIYGDGTKEYTEEIEKKIEKTYRIVFGEDPDYRFNVWNEDKQELAFRRNATSIRDYFEGRFEELFGFRLFLQVEVENNELYLLFDNELNNLNELNEEDRLLVEYFIFNDDVPSDNPSVIKRFHTENLEALLNLRIGHDKIVK